MECGGKTDPQTQKEPVFPVFRALKGNNISTGLVLVVACLWFMRTSSEVSEHLFPRKLQRELFFSVETWVRTQCRWTHLWLPLLPPTNDLEWGRDQILELGYSTTGHQDSLRKMSRCAQFTYYSVLLKQDEWKCALYHSAICTLMRATKVNTAFF